MPELITPMGHSYDPGCLCDKCRTVRIYRRVDGAINWANGSLLDGVRRVNLKPEPGQLVSMKQWQALGLRRASDNEAKFVRIGA